MDSERILIVDDERDTLGLIELTLQTAGYLVTTALSGAQALSLLEEDTFSLLLLDVMMPDMTGFEIIQSLRQKGSSIPPIVFLTAKGREEDVEMGKELGAVAYLKKPTTRGDLLDTIRAALGK
jgi:DNA-binding response OmpR family regulator